MLSVLQNTFKIDDNWLQKRLDIENKEVILNRFFQSMKTFNPTCEVQC